MIIDVQNTVKGSKNGHMAHLCLSRILGLGTFVIVITVSQCAAGQAIFSWQATDGPPIFSDRPPFDATDITVKKLSKPLSSIPRSRINEERHSEKALSKTPANDSYRELPLACKPIPSIDP